MRATNRHGFTLIELLVVITIIVVLLALLTPALDKAIYQATLVQCGARQHGIANASVMYAFNARRSYPNARPDAWKQNSVILYVGGTVNSLPNNPQGQNFDVRPFFYPAFLGSFDFFVDPVTDAIDVSYEANDRDCQIFSDYHVNAGWGPSGQGHMRRLGQGFTWTEDGVRREIRVLVSDKNEVDRLTRAAKGSNHPDDAGMLSFTSRQNAENPDQSAQSRATDLYPKKTIGGYGGSDKRGGLSVNYAYDDGSVRRYDNVTTTDERMFLVPHENAAAGDQRRTLVPVTN